MATGVVFSSEAAKRIAATVRRVEKIGVNLTGDRRPSQPQETSFWAGIVSCDVIGHRHYSWVKVEPLVDDPSVSTENRLVLIYQLPVQVNWSSAREANNNIVSPGTIVRLYFAGYNKEGNPTYIFTHTENQQEPGYLPCHDHRNNEPGNGGFSFACYHPGSSIPQHQFAI